jgi:serine/threonine protein phosphatase PrpC
LAGQAEEVAASRNAVQRINPVDGDTTLERESSMLGAIRSREDIALEKESSMPGDKILFEKTMEGMVQMGNETSMKVQRINPLDGNTMLERESSMLGAIRSREDILLEKESSMPGDRFLYEQTIRTEQEPTTVFAVSTQEDNEPEKESSMPKDEDARSLQILLRLRQAFFEYQTLGSYSDLTVFSDTSVQSMLFSSPTAFSHQGSNDNFEFVYSGLQGLRPYMEDRSCAVLNLPGVENASLFGVFDGHGGDQASEFIASNFPTIVSSCLATGAEPADALVEAFRQMDDQLWEHPANTDSLSPYSEDSLAHPYSLVGSTAVVVLALRESSGCRLICANCGDSRAVLSRSGKAVEMSEDHEPQLPEERARIEAAGGAVTQYMEPCYRVDRGVNMSRALADFAYKSNPDKPRDQQKVISVPDIQTYTLDKDDEFFALCSDGVSYVFEPQDLVTNLRDALKGMEKPPSSIEALKIAVNSAVIRSMPSGDNVTICCVRALQG